MDNIDEIIAGAEPIVRSALSPQEQRVLVKTVLRWNDERKISKARGVLYAKQFTPIQSAVISKICKASLDQNRTVGDLPGPWAAAMSRFIAENM